MNSGLGKGVCSIRRSEEIKDPFSGQIECKKAKSKSLFQTLSVDKKKFLNYTIEEEIYNKVPRVSSWSLIIRASKTSFATKLHKAAIACNEGPTGGQCLQAAPHAEPDLTRGSRVLGRGKSRSISKSIRLPRRYPSLAKLPETDKEMITFQVLQGKC